MTMRTMLKAQMMLMSHTMKNQAHNKRIPMNKTQKNTALTIPKLIMNIAKQIRKSQLRILRAQ